MRHVLILNDFALNRDLLRQQLETIGVKVTACDSPKNALELLDQSVDLIICDQANSGMNGLAFAREARDLGHHQRIVLLSSNPGHLRRDANSESVDLIAQRPFFRRDLFGWMSEPVGPKPQAKDPDQKTDTDTSRHTMNSVLQAAPDQPDQSEPDQPKLMRILAAEDNKTNQLVFGKMLKNLNIELRFACDGEEAVQAYQEFEPDLVFMDISMPRLDGKDATRAIRKLEAETGKHVPVIALTAHAMAGDDQEILSAGLDEYLTKPLRKPQIIEQIQRHCPTEAAHPLTDENSVQAAG